MTHFLCFNRSQQDTLLYAVRGIIYPGTRVMHTYQGQYKVCRSVFYSTRVMHFFLLRVHHTYRYTGTVHGLSRNLASTWYLCIPISGTYR